MLVLVLLVVVQCELIYVTNSSYIRKYTMVKDKDTVISLSCAQPFTLEIYDYTASADPVTKYGVTNKFTYTIYNTNNIVNHIVNLLHVVRWVSLKRLPADHIKIVINNF